MRTRPGAGLNRIRLRRVLVRDSSGPRCPSAPERVCWRHVDGHACRLSSTKPPRAKLPRKCCIAFVPMSRGRSLRRSFASSFCLFSASWRKFCGVIVWSVREKYYFCVSPKGLACATARRLAGEPNRSPVVIYTLHAKTRALPCLFHIHKPRQSWHELSVSHVSYYE